MIDIKKEIRYVAAVMNEVPMFLFRNFTKGGYSFTDNISVASKCIGKQTAEDMINIYRKETNDAQSITILPIEVSYKIVE